MTKYPAYHAAEGLIVDMTVDEFPVRFYGDDQDFQDIKALKGSRGTRVDCVARAEECYPPAVRYLTGSKDTYIELQQDFYLRSVRGVGRISRWEMEALTKEPEVNDGVQEEPEAVPETEQEVDVIEVWDGPKKGGKKRPISQKKKFEDWEVKARVISLRRKRACTKKKRRRKK